MTELLAYVPPFQVVGATIRDANGGYVAELSSPHGGPARDAMVHFIVGAMNAAPVPQCDAEPVAWSQRPLVFPEGEHPSYTHVSRVKTGPYPFPLYATPPSEAGREEIRNLIKAATDCVSGYPIASGRIVSTEGDGYGALRSLRIALEALSHPETGDGK